MGATDVVVDPGVFNELTIQRFEEISAVSATGGSRVVRGNVDRIIVSGELVAEHVSVVAMSLPRGLIAEGMLGASYLQRFPFFVDYEKEILEFWI